MGKNLYIAAITRAEFSKITGLPKYMILRHKDKFEWLDWESTGVNLDSTQLSQLKDRIILNETNLLSAKNILSAKSVLGHKIGSL